MSSTLQITMFGELSITYNDRPVAGVHTARSQALLAYLILHRQSPQSRQRIAFQLWTDSTDTQARSNLRKELSYLRRDLPQADQFLLVEPKTLQWSPTATFSLDVMEFEDALNAAEAADSGTTEALLKQAIALYKGELLPSCEDEWIVPERERLQQRYIGALQQLIECLQKQQNYRSALSYAQQLLRVDALNEATYCTLMRLYNYNGDRANALQIYHRCMAVLREELGVNPSPTTRKLYEQLLLQDELPADEVSAQSPVSLRISPLPRWSVSDHRSAPFPLVGRKREWNLIQEWISRDIRDAPFPLLLLMGEPGIGKTRLLEELQQTVPIALWGRGFAAERVRPYGIWIDALRSVVLPSNMPSELGFLLPEVGQPITAPPEIPPARLRDRSHLFDAVVQLLTEWASQNPLVIMLDDIQWMDEASSALLHYANRLLNHLPIKFACTARSGELSENNAISQVILALRREQRLQIIELQAFDRGETSDLIRTVSVNHPFDLSIETVDQVFTESGGNPLFVMEIARALSQNKSTHMDNLEALIGDRLQQLNPSAREVLPWAAALGRSFKPAIVAQVADYSLTQLLTAIEQLEQQSIIRPSTVSEHEMGYDFAHDIVRQVVYQQLSEPRRQLIHLQIARQLNQRAASDNALAGDIAHHAALGGDHELAASAALLAAERCLKLFAYAEASTLAEHGMQHCQFLNEQLRISLQLQLLEVIVLSGVTGDRAVQIEAEVNQFMDEARRYRLKDEEAIGMRILGVLHLNQNKYANFHQHSLKAAEMSREASPATAARLLALSGSCLVELGREMNRAEALLLEAQSLAARVGLQLHLIPISLGSIYLYRGQYDAARTTMQQARQWTQVTKEHWHEYYCLSYLAMLELEAGHPTAALPYCHEMAMIAAKSKAEETEGTVADALKALANYQSRAADSEIALESAIYYLKQVDDKRMLAYILIGAAEIDLNRQQFEVAAVRAETALQAAQTVNHPSEVALAGAILIQSVLACGEIERAIAQFELLQSQINHTFLSARAQAMVDRTIQQIQTISLRPSSNHP